MSHTPTEIIKMRERHQRRMIGCTTLQQEDLQAEYLQALPVIEWEIELVDIRRCGESFQLSGRVRAAGPWGFGSDNLSVLAELNEGVGRESLARLKPGQRVRLAGIPHYFDGDGEYAPGFTIKSARLL